MPSTTAVEVFAARVTINVLGIRSQLSLVLNNSQGAESVVQCLPEMHGAREQLLGCCPLEMASGDK